MLDPIEGKIISFLHGEPTITYTKKEFEKLSIRQNLPFAGVAKFSYVRPYLNELRKILPIQLEIKGTCPMGYLDERRILLRLSLLEDYATLLSKACELKVRNRYFPIRFLKWDPWFNPEEETTIAIAWISFPGLPTNLFDKESMFSLASAVGTPLIIDKGTHNRTRPSCARVKVEVDLLKELPKRIQINCVDAETGEVKSKWQKIQYDYLPKYCTQCKLQGHDLNGCWVLHPQHRTKKEEQRDEKKELEKGKAKEESSKQNGKQDSKEATHNGVYRNGKLVYENWNVVQNRKNKGNGKETEQQRGNKAKEPTTTNKFGTLVDLTEEMQEETNMVNKSNGDLKETSRPWVDKVFRKMDDQANDIENSSKEDAVKVNQSNEGNSKEKSDSANSDEQQGNTSKEQQTNLKGKSHSNIEEQEVNTQNSECPREAAECPVQFNNQQQVQKFSPIETEDFRHCIDACQLMDLGFTGSIFTWWNGRSDEACIFKRLDRCLGNQALQNTYPNLQVEHLIKQGSDHNSLLISLKQDSGPIQKAFRFLNFWVEHANFLEVVKNNWDPNYNSDPFYNIHQKLKKVSKAPSIWSKEAYGDIFRQIATLEEVVRIHEQELEQHPSEKFWKQKAGMQWFKDGDRNTKFFHAHVNGKRRDYNFREFKIVWWSMAGNRGRHRRRGY
ncbi:uncharacterized protein LOC132644331 [Lycium barbarum]|uniref:uncharacterized protein LOC132644331 n=1 Tax=Lycium barbarum TaxID=112863 RepID=UPI00293F43FC|nr:uncharacterized protein LOC132644331 [Lycium barbarum]